MFDGERIVGDNGVMACTWAAYRKTLFFSCVNVAEVGVQNYKVGGYVCNFRRSLG